MKVGIVCGYGNILDENLKQYVRGVITSALEQNLSAIILTGGCTFKRSTVSEAKLMFEMISEQNTNLQILLEENALTTLHNLLYSKQIIAASNLDIEALYIFCDHARSIKIYLLSKILFNDKIVRLIKIGRSENPLIYLMQIPSTFVQCLGVFFPNMEKKILMDKQNWINKYR